MTARSKSDLRNRRRDDYKFSKQYQTRWSDNDQYGHVNNAVYYFFIDSIVNSFLISQCGQDPRSSGLLGLVVSSHCTFFRPISFPSAVDVCMSVVTIGRSSVEYEIALFEVGRSDVCAVGGYTHVFVENKSRKSGILSKKLHEGLETILRYSKPPSKARL